MLIYNERVVKIDHFPDGTILMKCEVMQRQEHFITWVFESNEELVALIYLVNHIRSNPDASHEITLYMDYIPNARQDRVKNPEDVFTLKYFASIINSLGFSHVYVSDPHSPVSEALINNIVVLKADDRIRKLYERISRESTSPVLMFYPDEGAMKRYSGAVDAPYTFGIKRRDWKTGRIMGLDVSGEIDQIKGSNILIADDICSRGGTFTHSARRLKELGAENIFLYVTHCEKTILDGTVLTDGLIEKVFTTDSLPAVNDEKIEVLL